MLRANLFACCASAALLLGLSGASVQAAPILFDDFESYPSGDSAAFDAAWIVQTVGVIKPVIASGPAAPNTTQAVSFPANGSNNTGRRQKTFTNTVPTSTDILRWSFDFYDTTGSTGASYRQYSELYANNEASANALTQLIAIGVNNAATGGIPTSGGTASTLNTAKYQARIAFGTGGGWINLAANRSIGWHNFAAEFDGSKIDFFVDGVFDTSFTNGGGATGASVGYQEVRIGSALSSTGGGAFYDNVTLTIVPEPASLSLLAIAGLAMLRRKRA